MPNINLVFRACVYFDTTCFYFDTKFSKQFENYFDEMQKLKKLSHLNRSDFLELRSDF